MPDEKFETPHVLHDLPLKQDETARFHFDKFAITLARLIASKETKTPLTIGVSGAWGSGKTTLLKRTKAMLDGTPNIKGGTKPDELKFVTENEFTADKFRICKTVWFDVWKYAGEDQILAALLRAIVEAMRRDGFWNAIKAELKGARKEELKWLDLFTSALTTFVSAGTYTLNLADFRVDTPLREASAFFDYFDDAFKRLLAAWVNGKLAGDTDIKEEEGVLVVFIDDLDRCLPKKIIEVLEAVKLFLDKTGCVFVLGAHTDIIREAVKKHYIEEGLKEQDAADYLDKFIQLRFDLPPAPEEEMEAYVKQLTVDDTLSGHWRLLTIGAGYNPRKVKVFLNDLSLRWAIWQNIWQARQVEYEDFVRWEVWMGSSPRFRQRVHDVGKTDLSLLSKMVDEAFLWAGGQEEAKAGFSDAVTENMRFVLKEILPYKDRFTLEVMDSLLHLAPPLQKPVPSTEKTSVEIEEAVQEKKARKDYGLKPELGKYRVEGAPVELRKGVIIGGIEFVHIPTGKFIMGSKDDNLLASDGEKPQHTLELPDYWMARFPLTNEQYAVYIGEGKHPVSDWKKKKNHPVVKVSWNDAIEYCKWFNTTYAEDLKKHGITLHLPTEAQWEKAARGEYGNEWPWGNEFDPGKCNSREGGKGGTTPVDAYPEGASPFGVLDMVGNVWEWTHSHWGNYPYPSDKKGMAERENEKASGSRVLRGGSWNYNQYIARCAYRDNPPPS